MHLLPTSEIRLDDGEDAVDLCLPPGDVLVLSFADSDLAALAAAAGAGPVSVRLASLRRLRHPLSVDLMIEKTAARCRFVLVRCLGGLDYWRYGIEQLAETCRAKGIALAVLPGDDRDDERLAGYGTVPLACAQAILGYFRAGGAENMRRMLAVADGFLKRHGSGSERRAIAGRPAPHRSPSPGGGGVSGAPWTGTPADLAPSPCRRSSHWEKARRRSTGVTRWPILPPAQPSSLSSSTAPASAPGTRRWPRRLPRRSRNAATHRSFSL